MQPTPVTNADIRVINSGISLRRAEREKKIGFVRRVTEHAIAEFLPGLASPDIEYADYDRDLKHLIGELRTWASNAHELKIARAHLARLISQHNKQHGTTFPIPPPLSRLYPDKLLRTQQWSESRRKLNQSHERWLKGLDTRTGIDLPVDMRLGLFLYVSATYGGLCIPAAIEALREAIERPRPIEHCSRTGLYWIDLYYEHGQLTNATKGKKDVVYRPWILTPMCKLAAFGYLQHRGRCADHEVAESPDTFDLIMQSFVRVAGSELPFPSLSKFLRVAFCIAERQPGSSMTQLHAEYSIGRVPSMSLRPADWRRLLAISNDYLPSEASSWQ